MKVKFLKIGCDRVVSIVVDLRWFLQKCFHLVSLFLTEVNIVLSIRITDAELTG